MKKFFEYDTINFRLGKVRRKVGKTLLWAVLYFFVTLTIAILAYSLFSLFISTDVEKQLKAEIRMYEELYPSLVPQEEVVGDAIASLQHKDNRIYEQVFHADAPAADPMARLDIFFAADTIPEIQLFSYTRDKADSLLDRAARVDRAFEKIFRTLSDSAFVTPPMMLPVEDVSYSQIGASVGKKMDPFYKAYVFHEGLDILVPRGTPVLAVGNGEGQSVSTSKKFGKTVEISLEGGYVIRYSHLETVSVKQGQKVESGAKIGTSGVTGKSFAPHLHYELSLDGRILDPVHYLFASVSADEYANMLFMAVNTMQSMD